MPITETVRTILIAAAGHSQRAVAFPERLPIAAQRAVAQSMLKAGLIEAIDRGGEQPAWRATEAGLAEIEPHARGSAQTLASGQDGSAGCNPVRVQRSSLRGLAEALRDKLKPKQAAAITRQLRPDTKRAVVLSLLERPEGATVSQVADATGWARHTVHGFFAGLKKAGMAVDVLDRVRQVGAGRGAKGSYTVYAIKGAR